MFSVIKHHDCKVFSTKNVYRLFSNRMLLLTVNVYKHVSFTRLMPFKIKAVMSTTMLVMENLSHDTIVTQINFPIDVKNKTWNFQNIRDNYKTKASTSH